MGRRLLLRSAAVEALRVAVGPLEVLAVEAGDVVRIEGRAGDWRVDRTVLDGTPALTLSPVVTTPREAEDAPRPTGPPPTVAAAPFLAVLDLPPLPAAETDGRPLAAVALDPWRPMAVHVGSSVEGLAPKGRADQPASVGRLVAALSPGVLHRWDETAVLRVRWEGGAFESRSAEAALSDGRLLAIETSAGWELARYRIATLEGDGVWRLSGLLRGQQGTEARAGATTGGLVVLVTPDLVRLDLAEEEAGAPLLWRAGPDGAPPGGPLFAEVEAAWTRVHDRPWAPARLTTAPVEGGMALSWRARTRTGGDRWDGEVEASDPARFRVRILDGGVERRRWEVEGEATVYSDSQRAVDLPDGGGAVAVSQWNPRHGWGAEAVRALD